MGGDAGSGRRGRGGGTLGEPEADAGGLGAATPADACAAEVQAGRGARPAAARRRDGALLGRLFAGIWLIYLIYPASHLASAHLPAWHRALGAVALLAFAVDYVWIFWNGYGRRGFAAMLPLFGLSAAVTLLVGGNGLPLLIYCAAATSLLRPDRLGAAMSGAITVALVAALVAIHAGLDTTITLGMTCAFAGGATLAARRLVATRLSLHAAEQEVARLAAVEERFRIARDVHDLLGHSLSVIVLKADLARRLLSSDPPRAAAEIADVEAVARRSLTDVREAVAGYRRLRVTDELSRGAAALEAAGVRCTVIRTAGDMPEAVDAVLAWVVREAVTNVMRHSGARACQIQVALRQDHAEARIEDDGRGPGGAAGPAAEAGSGLAGLRERLELVGGTLWSGDRPGGGYRVVAAVPLPGGAAPGRRGAGNADGRPDREAAGGGAGTEAAAAVRR